MLQVGVILGKANRIHRRNQGCRGRQRDLLRLCRKERKEGRRVAGGNEWRVVVLAGCENVEADLFRMLGNLNGCLDALVLCGRLAAFVGSVVTSPIVKTPNCMLLSFSKNSLNLNYLRQRGIC